MPPIKALSVCDAFTRENVARRLDRSITADDVTHALDEGCAGAWRSRIPRCDNGPEFVALAIRDWCRARGTGTAYIEPGSSWQNPYVESFNGRLRDELFSREVFDTITEARLLFNDWCDTYNLHRHHSSLGYVPPAVFAAAFNQPKPSSTMDHQTGIGQILRRGPRRRYMYPALLLIIPRGSRCG
jgi:putative transposase